MIKLINTSFHFTDISVLKSIDLQLCPGEFTAIMGSNGSGKTTLRKLIGGQIEPDEGTRAVQPGARVITLEQDPDVTPFATLHDFALAGEYAPPAHDVEAIADQLGIDLSREANTASGGERRRGRGPLRAEYVGLLRSVHRTVGGALPSWIQGPMFLAAPAVRRLGRAGLEAPPRSGLYADGS